MKLIPNACRIRFVLTVPVYLVTEHSVKDTGILPDGHTIVDEIPPLM